MGFHGASSQLEITPLQRQILEHEHNRRAEAKNNQMNGQMPSTGGGNQRTRNSRAGAGKAGGKMDQSETVRYINRSENPEHSL